MSDMLPVLHVLVPTVPTAEMLLAGHHRIDWCRDGQRTNVLDDPSQVEVIGGSTIGTTCKEDLIDAWTAMLAAAPPAAGKGEEVELDLYDAIVQRAIKWTLEQVGRQLGAKHWDGGDGSESVEGDVGAEITNIMRAAGLVDVDGEPLHRETYRAQPQVREGAA